MRYLPRPRLMASRASLSAVRRRSVSRLSHSCLPLARASSTFTLPFLKYMRVGISVRPFLLGLADQLADLFSVHQQLAGAQRGMVGMLPCS